MAAGVGVWSLATAGAGLARNFPQMAFARARWASGSGGTRQSRRP